MYRGGSRIRPKKIRKMPSGRYRYKNLLFQRKIPVSVKFVSAIPGPESAALVLWTPGKMRSFCRKTYVHKIPRFRGGVFLGLGGGGSADFIFMGARILLKEGVFIEKGPFFHGKGASRAPQTQTPPPPPAPSPSPPSLGDPY